MMIRNFNYNIRYLIIISTLISITLLLASFSPLLHSSLSNQLSKENNQSPGSSSSPEEVPFEFSTPQSTFQRSTRGDSFDYELTGIQEVGNITLQSFSRMIIKDADVTVNGVITISDYATLFIINSKVIVNPPTLHENTSVISLTNLASLRISESNVTVNSCPNPTSVPFILTDDESSLIITDSDFSAILPEITEMLSKMEGSLIVSGQSMWIVRNSFVNAVPNDLGGWFWLGLVGGNLDIIESTFYTESHMVDLFAHSFGTMRIIDSTIIGRTIYEGNSVGEIINSKLMPEPGGFTSLGAIDYASCTIINSTFEGLVGLNDETVMEVRNSTFDETRGVRVAKNATISLIDCNVAPHCDLLQNGTLIAYGSSDIDVHILDIPIINLYSNCTISIWESSIKELGINENDNVFLYAQNSIIEKIMANDNVDIIGDLDYSTITELKLGEENDINLTLINTSNIDHLLSNKNCTLNFTLVDNSTIDEITRDEDTFLFITIDSPTPEITGTDVTVLIKHRLFIRTRLNHNDISTTVDISDIDGQVDLGQSDNGALTFILLYQKLDDFGTQTVDKYFISSSYYGLNYNYEITLEKSKELFVDFEDYTPPVISEFKYEKQLWNLDNKVTYSMRVEVRVEDEDIQEVSNVTIMFRTEKDTAWREIPMTHLGEGLYEGIIPEQGMGDNVRFYVEANDIAHNSALTSIITYSERMENLIFLWSLFILLLVSLITVIILKINKIRKIRRYIGNKASISGQQAPEIQKGMEE